MTALVVVVGSLLTAWVSTTAFADDTTAREPLPESWQADSELTDVFFIDENLGWIVGESGTTLRLSLIHI